MSKLTTSTGGSSLLVRSLATAGGPTSYRVDRVNIQSHIYMY